MLSYNEVTPKKVILMDDEPYVVVSSWVFRKQQRKPVNQTKLRNLKTGSVVEKTFHQNDSIEEAEIEARTAKFIYTRNGEYWFSDPKKPADRYTIPEDIVGQEGKFLKPNSEIDTQWFNDEPIMVKVPIKMELKVTEAPPAVRGNTVQGGYKLVTLETGATVQTPLFVDVGDTIVVNTEKGEYVERV